LIHPRILDHLKAQIDDEIAEAGKIVVGGGAADLADYRQRVGYIKGLERLRAIIIDLTEDKEKRQ
jgi:hypothetical protein